MQYKDYGKTGKKVSAVSFGGMRFIHDEYKDSNYEKCAQIVRRASELGINYFDTAPGYCDMKSESIFGEAFKNMPNPFYVSTKISMEGGTVSADKTRARIEEALKVMGVPKINFFYLWCLMDYNQYTRAMEKGRAYEAALKAKEEGLIDHICFSTHASGEDIEKMVENNEFEGILLGYNAVNFLHRQKGIKAAYAKQMGVATMNPLGGGLIPEHPELFSFLCRDDKESIAQASIRFNISHKEITTALAGMRSIADVEENVKAGDNFTELSDDEIKDLSKKVRLNINDLCTLCGYCVKDCPAELPVNKLVESYNEILIGNTDDNILGKLKWHWGVDPKEAGKCIECGRCETVCTQKLPIIQRLNYVSKLEMK